MSKNIKRPSADDVREMARHTHDPVIERTLRQLARDMDEEQARDARIQPTQRSA
jgi:hypothetical protein